MRLRGLLFALIIVAPPLLLHVSHLGPGRIPYLRDLSRTHLPIKALAVRELRAGRLPLWNPTHGAGSPLLANPNFFHFHPVTALFLVLPYPTAFSFGLAALSLFGAIGVAGWLRARGASRTAAACGAAAFAIGGLGASLTNLYNLLASYSSVPWALWAAEGIGGPGGRRRVGLLALALAAVIAGGEPSAWGWGVLLAGGLLVERLRHQRRVGVGFLTLAGAAFLSLNLAAVQLLPLLRMTPDTVRGAGFTYRGATYNSVHPYRLLELARPRLLGDPTEPWRPDYRGRDLTDGGVPFFYSLYAGLSVLALAAIGLGRRAGGRATLGLFAVVSVLLAVGHHLPFYEPIWRAVPPLGWFRYPEKFLLPLYLAIAALAAAGVDVVTARGGRRLGPLLAPVLPVLVTIDLLAAHLALVPGTDAGPFLAPPEITSQLTDRRTYFWLERERWAPTAPDRAGFHLAYQTTGVPPALAPFDVRYVLDPDPDILDPLRMADLGRLVHRSADDRARLLPITAVERVISPEPLNQRWLESLSNGPPHLYAVREPIPFARVVPAARVIVVADASRAAERLGRPDFDPHRHAVFEAPLPASSVDTEATAVGWSRPAPSVLELRATGPGLLVVSEAWDAGWTATVDGAPTALAPANLAFIGLALASGPHQIRLAYWPEGLTVGLTLSALATLVLVALVTFRGRPPAGGPSESDRERGRSQG